MVPGHGVSSSTELLMAQNLRASSSIGTSRKIRDPPKNLPPFSRWSSRWSKVNHWVISGSWDTLPSSRVIAAMLVSNSHHAVPCRAPKVLTPRRSSQGELFRLRRLTSAVSKCRCQSNNSRAIIGASSGWGSGPYVDFFSWMCNDVHHLQKWGNMATIGF